MAMRGISVLFLVIMASVKSEYEHLHEEYVVPTDENDTDNKSNDADEEYFRHIYSMIDGHRSDLLGGQFVIERNALINTKYKALKRNADLINSLLALPKGMNDAGR